MRIAWFTPFHPRSAIGAYSLTVAQELAKRDEVVIAAPAGDGEAAPREWNGPTIVIDDADDPAEDPFTGFDLCVYNFGNHHADHRLIHRHAMRRPGIVIPHDPVMRDFFRATAGDGGRFLELQALARPDAGQLIETPERTELPMFAPILWGALGAIVHAEDTRKAVTDCAVCPVATLDFPGEPPFRGSGAVERYASRFREFAEVVRSHRAILEAADGAARAMADISPRVPDAVIDAMVGRLAAWSPRPAASSTPRMAAFCP